MLALEENRELLRRFRAGERPALQAVYQSYAPVLASFLRAGFSFQSGPKRCRFMGVQSQFDLEDRLHDVFIRAFSENARLGYDGLTPFKTYLFTIARNLVIDDFRKKERALVDYRVESIDAEAEPSDAHEPFLGHLGGSGDPRKDTENAELLRLVGDFRGQLKGRERDVYQLRFVSELEHKQIAEQTGLSPSQIKTSEQKLREQFFTFMQKHGYFKGYIQEPRGWLKLLRSW